MSRQLVKSLIKQTRNPSFSNTNRKSKQMLNFPEQLNYKPQYNYQESTQQQIQENQNLNQTFQQLEQQQQQQEIPIVGESRINVNKQKNQIQIGIRKKTAKLFQQVEDYRNLRIGFIGVGTISKSMVKGLLNESLPADKRAQRVIVSPRGRANAQELASEFNQVKIAASNQEVIDNSDWIIIGLLTTQIEESLKNLKFRPNQTIVNLAAMSNETFKKCVNGKVKNIIRACPLPPIALNVGATIIQPPHKGVQKMFDALGTSVPVQSSHEIYSLQGIACLMGPQYAIFQTCYDWMVNKQQIDPKTAKKYIMGTYHSICVDALDKISNQGHSFKDLVEEQTPGGLNENNLKDMEDRGVNQHFVDVLDKTYKKMTAKL